MIDDPFAGKPAGRGFTLIELSIVLIIIALIAGGVLLKKTMSNAAQLQNMITNETQYVEAARQFKERFGFPPGDFPNAAQYWGAASSCPQSTATAPQAATCNGNGNGLIESDGMGQGAATSWETFTAWQQLADAGLIAGAFTGAPGPAGSANAKPGLNVPETKRATGGFQWYAFSAGGSNIGAPSNNWWFSPVYYKQYLLLGAQRTGSNDLAEPILTGVEALSLDRKIDDGLPGSGLVTSSNSNMQFGGSACASTAVASSAVYNNQAILACLLLFQVNW